RVVMSNRWLTGPLVRRILAGKSSTNASIRTTAAVTMLSGSDKENVLPRRATARINLRLLPGDTVDEALDHLRRVIDDPEVSVAVVGGFSSEASAVSRWDGPVWDQLADTIRAAFPDAAVAPFLMVGATDARRFAPHCDAVFRFSPFRLDPEDLQRLHGVDERVSVDALPRAAGFYVRWLEAAAGPG
ncbi:MAG: M20/M25/M40 family metallo-hydrolase, partial [Myxococcota bacterium]